MSNDENPSQSEELVSEASDKISEVKDDLTSKASEAETLADEAVDKASEVKDDLVSKVNETKEVVNEAVGESSNIKEGLVSKVTELKETNPKVFFGGLAALAIVIISVMSMGGSDKKIPTHNAVNLSVGQTYKLKGINTYDPESKIRLVAVPGSLAAYDDTEESDRNEPCKQISQGTKVKLVQIQAAIGKAKYVQVEMVEGKCAGQKGWTNSNNLK